MSRHNDVEYKFVRDELAALRVCMTSYMSLALGGSAFGLATPLGLAKEETLFVVGFGLGLVSLVLVALLGVLFYKFHSHNRYAGYAKLVAQERPTGPVPPACNGLVLWESCLDKMRPIESTKDEALIAHWRTICENVTVTGMGPDQRGASWMDAISRKRISLMRRPLLLLKFLLPVRKTTSWRFPLSLLRVMATLIAAFWTAGLLVMLAEQGNFKGDAGVARALWASMWVILAIDLGMLFSYVARLEDLLNGKDTVDAFCWKFLPLRFVALQLNGIDVEYWTIP